MGHHGPHPRVQHSGRGQQRSRGRAEAPSESKGLEGRGAGAIYRVWATAPGKEHVETERWFFNQRHPRRPPGRGTKYCSEQCGFRHLNAPGVLAVPVLGWGAQETWDKAKLALQSLIPRGGEMRKGGKEQTGSLISIMQMLRNCCSACYL